MLSLRTVIVMSREMLDPIHLRPVELDYELRIRGIFGIGTTRRKTMILRDHLRKEIDGLEAEPTSSSLHFPIEDELTACAEILAGIKLIVTDVTKRSNSLFKGEAIHRLIHVTRRLHRLSPNNIDQEQNVNLLQNMCVEIQNEIRTSESETVQEQRAASSKSSMAAQRSSQANGLPFCLPTARPSAGVVIEPTRLSIDRRPATQDRNSLFSTVSTGLPGYTPYAGDRFTPELIDQRVGWHLADDIFRMTRCDDDVCELGAVGGSTLNPRAKDFRPSTTEPTIETDVDVPVRNDKSNNDLHDKESRPTERVSKETNHEARYNLGSQNNQTFTYERFNKQVNKRPTINDNYFASRVHEEEEMIDLCEVGSQERCDREYETGVNSNTVGHPLGPVRREPSTQRRYASEDYETDQVQIPLPLRRSDRQVSENVGFGYRSQLPLRSVRPPSIREPDNYDDRYRFLLRRDHLPNRGRAENYDDRFQLVSRGDEVPHRPNINYREPNFGSEGDRRRCAARPMRKSVPVNQWRINFSGDGRGLHLYDFLSQVSLFQRSEMISDEELMYSLVHLLTGRARQWYASLGNSIDSWEEMVESLKYEFLPLDYDFHLLNDISTRRQKNTESFGEYITLMNSLFRWLNVPISESHKVFIVKKNLLPKYAVGVAANNLRTIRELTEVCRRIDSSLTATTPGRTISLPFEANSYYPNGGNRNHLLSRPAQIAEIDLDENGEDLYCENEICALKSSRGQGNSGAFKCYNCRKDGHVFRSCPAPREGIFCYSCGVKDVTVKNCSKCTSGNLGRDQGNQASRPGPENATPGPMAGTSGNPM